MNKHIRALRVIRQVKVDGDHMFVPRYSWRRASLSKKQALSLKLNDIRNNWNSLPSDMKFDLTPFQSVETLGHLILNHSKITNLTLACPKNSCSKRVEIGVLTLSLHFTRDHGEQVSVENVMDFLDLVQIKQQVLNLGNGHSFKPADKAVLLAALRLAEYLCTPTPKEYGDRKRKAESTELDVIGGPSLKQQKVNPETNGITKPALPPTFIFNPSAPTSIPVAVPESLSKVLPSKPSDNQSNMNNSTNHSTSERITSNENKAPLPSRSETLATDDDNTAEPSKGKKVDSNEINATEPSKTEKLTSNENSATITVNAVNPNKIKTIAELSTMANSSVGALLSKAGTEESPTNRPTQETPLAQLQQSAQTTTKPKGVIFPVSRSAAGPVPPSSSKESLSIQELDPIEFQKSETSTVTTGSDISRPLVVQNKPRTRNHILRDPNIIKERGALIKTLSESIEKSFNESLREVKEKVEKEYELLFKRNQEDLVNQVKALKQEVHDSCDAAQKSFVDLSAKKRHDVKEVASIESDKIKQTISSSSNHMLDTLYKHIDEGTRILTVKGDNYAKQMSLYLERAKKHSDMAFEWAGKLNKAIESSESRSSELEKNLWEKFNGLKEQLLSDTEQRRTAVHEESNAELKKQVQSLTIQCMNMSKALAEQNTRYEELEEKIRKSETLPNAEVERKESRRALLPDPTTKRLYETERTAIFSEMKKLLHR